MSLLSHSSSEYTEVILILCTHSDSIKCLGIGFVFPLSMVMSQVDGSETSPQRLSSIPVGLVILRATWLLEDETTSDRLELKKIIYNLCRYS